MSEMLLSINPHDQSIIGETPITKPEQLQQAFQKAKQAQKSWSQIPLQDRANYIKKLSSLYRENKEQLAQLTSKEMGKPITQARDDVDWEIEFIDWYVTDGIKALEAETINSESEHFTIVYEPYGVVACIAPWNFPLSMTNSGTLPALLAGNTVLFKPSEHTTMTQKLAVGLIQQTGIPDGVVQNIIGGKDIGKQLVDLPINYVWFTGSTAVGKEIYKKCAEKFIRCTLELGGSSPAIVFSDYPEHTIETLFWARFLCSGQVCSAIKRLFVEKSVYEEVIQKLKDKIKEAKVGDPLQKDTVIGPLVSKIQLEKLKSQVQDAIDKGAHVMFGGKIPTEQNLINGNYFEPTLLTNITQDMRIMNEEVFGPVLPIVSFETEAQAVELANDTEYGLSAEIYTKDIEKAKRIMSQIQAGSVGINTDSLYKPNCPTGGYKHSGIGREYSYHGMREFAQIKLIAEKK